MRLALACVLLLAACGDNRGPSPVPLVSGPAQIVFDDGTLYFTRDAAVMLTFAPGAFQVGTVADLDDGSSFDPFWLYSGLEPDGLAWHDTTPSVVASDERELELAFDVPGGRATLAIEPSSVGSFRAVFAATSPSAAYLRLRADADANEGFYGLGEYGDSVNHRGKLRPMQLEVDTTLESSNNENHVPVPLLVGARSPTTGWGLFVKSDRPGAFDVARQSDTLVEVTFGTGDASAAGIEVHLFSAPSPLDVYPHYFEVTGYPGLPAVWAYGPLLWRNEPMTQAVITDDIQQIRSLDLATSGIWFDRPYATGVNTFDWNPAKFPQPATMLQALHAAGLRYGIWQAPYAADGDNQDPAPEQHAYAMANGFFPPVTGVEVNQWGKPIDFTNPAAYAWWKSQLKKYTDPLELGGWGVEGFKLDYAEDVVLGISGGRVPWQFFDGSDERTMHYGYTMLYHQIHRELLPESGGFLLTRTGRWGDQTRGLIVWPGDLDADLSRMGDPLPGKSTKAVGGLPTALSFGLGLSASGFPFYASDTGGYRESPPNNETWLRWVEANTVWPAMQVGDASSEMPWEFNAENGRTTASLDIYRRYARLHMRLFPYVWSYAIAMRRTGHPIARPFGLVTAADHVADQYFLGEHLLVAPVITAGQTSRPVIFPFGDWYDWFTGEPYTIGMRTVDAPLDKLPLYIRGGGIVPMLRDTIDTLSPTTMTGVESYANDPGVLYVRVAPGAEQPAFTLFDGGKLEVTQQTRRFVFTPGTRFKQGIVFECIARQTAPAAVTDDALGALTQRTSLTALEGATEGWFYDATALRGTLWIKTPGAAAFTIN